MPSMKRTKSRSGLEAGAGGADSTSKAAVLRQYVQASLSSRVREVQSSAYVSFVKELQALRRKLEAGQDDEASEFSFVALLNALRDCAGALQNSCHDAVLTTVLGIGLWRCSAVVRDAVLDFVVELMSLPSGLTANGLQVLLFNLLPPPGSPLLPPDTPGAPWEVPPQAAEVQDAVVAAIEQAVGLLPALPERLLPLLLENMPHKLRDRPTQCLFLRAVLKLAEGRAGAAMREGLLAGVMEHLLGVDADIRWEDIVDAPTGYDAEEGDSEDDMFDLEGLIDLELDPGHPQHAAQQQDALMQLQDGFHDPAAFAAASHHHGARRAQELAAAAAGGQPGSSKPARAPVDVTADKLDSMMELVFGHLQRRVAAGQLAGAWETMLSVFEGRLLHAHRCKFTQFLLFFLAVQEPARCCGSFTAALMRLLRSPAQPAVTRCACAAYLASFLARCGPAPPALVVDVLHKLAAAAQEYADGALEAARRHQQAARAFHRVGSSSGGGGGGLPATSSNAALVLLAGLSDLMGQGPLNGVAAAGSTGAGGASSGSAGALAAIQRHQVFYAMVQALLYLLCYHMQPLFNAPAGSEQAAHGQALAGLVRQQVLPLLSHALAPLAVCHQAVTAEFVRQALLLGLADAEWEAAALEAVSQHQAALEIAASAATAVVVGGDNGSGSGGGGDASGASGAAGQLRVLRPLEVFFPFDPYLLRRSARFLELPRTYVCFSHGHPHAAGAAAAAGRRRRRGRGGEGGGDEQLSGSEDGEPEGDDDTTSDDEGDWQGQAVMDGDGSGSGSDSESSSSSDEDEDGDDHHQQPGGAPAPAAAATAASGGGVRLKRRAASLLPVGLAAAASGAPGGGGLSGPSPPADMMATSLLGTSGGMSFGSGGGGGGGLFGGPGGVGGGASPFGTSPMPMSITPHEGGTYMAALHSQLNGMRGGVVQ